MKKNTPEAHAIEQLVEVMKKLRDPREGCPWDRKQTLTSIFPYTLEEVYEVGDAIDRNDTHALKDELGDLLFQIVFYAQIASEKGDFDFSDIAQGITEKMIRRHPHVFGNTEYANEQEQKAAWEAIKQKEKKASSEAPNDFFGDITRGLTSLQRGQKILKRAAETGFDWPSWKPVIAKLHEEIEEIIEAVEENEPKHRIEEELGDLLIVIINLARHLGVDAENAARKSNNKFERRFNRMRELVTQHYPDSTEHTLDEMDHAWELVKKEEKAP